MSDQPFPKQAELDTNKLILVFGDQKAGKTSLIGTAPSDFKVHIIDTDGGWGPAKRAATRKGTDIEKMWSRVNPTTFKDLHAALWQLPSGNDLYVIDTYTTCMKLFKSSVQPAIQETDWKKVGGKVSGLAIDYFDHFRRQVAKEGAWGLILCQDKLKEVSPDVERLCPDLVGAAGRDAAGMVDMLLHYERQRDTKEENGKKVPYWKRVLRTAETPLCMAGDRTEALASPHEEPDLELIITKISNAQ